MTLCTVNGQVTCYIKISLEKIFECLICVDTILTASQSIQLINNRGGN